jgi:broad specificity phosphatase PhoE
MTEELRQAVTSQQRTIEAASSSVEKDVTHAQRELAVMNLDDEQNDEAYAERNAEVNDDEHEERENAIATLETLAETLKSARELLAELSTKTKDQEISQATASGQSTTNTFGANHQGMQIGVSHGSVTWNAKQ